MTGSESDAPGLARFPMPSWLAALPRRSGPITPSPMITTMCCRISVIASTPYSKRSKQRTDG